MKTEKRALLKVTQWPNEPLGYEEKRITFERYFETAEEAKDWADTINDTIWYRHEFKLNGQPYPG